MTLKSWVDYGWLRPHRTSRQEIADLLGIVDRDMSDAQARGISTDWQFGIAYNAALKLCTILLYQKDDELAKSHRVRWLSKKPQMQGAQTLRNEAYIRYAAVTKDAAQRSSWGVFATPSRIPCWPRAKHYRTIQALPLILGISRDPDATYLDTCRAKRNAVEYDRVGGTSGKEVAELIEFVKELRTDVVDWLRDKHGDMI